MQLLIATATPASRLASASLSHRPASAIGRRPLCHRMAAKSQSFLGVDVSKLPLIGGLFPRSSSGDGDKESSDAVEWARKAQATKRAAPAEAPEGLMLATFAAGCFWGPQVRWSMHVSVVLVS